MFYDSRTAKYFYWNDATTSYVPIVQQSIMEPAAVRNFSFSETHIFMIKMQGSTSTLSEKPDAATLAKQAAKEMEKWQKEQEKLKKQKKQTQHSQPIQQTSPQVPATSTLAPSVIPEASTVVPQALTTQSKFVSIDSQVMGLLMNLTVTN